MLKDGLSSIVGHGPNPVVAVKKWEHMVNQIEGQMMDYLSER